MIDLQREGEVWVLRANDGENRFRDDSIAAWNEALDEVERADGPKALVTTGTGKFYSNGLDLDWMMSTPGVDSGAYIRDVLAIMGRVLVFPAYTVSAINGHAFQLAAKADQCAVDHRLSTGAVCRVVSRGLDFNRPNSFGL